MNNVFCLRGRTAFHVGAKGQKENASTVTTVLTGSAERKLETAQRMVVSSVDLRNGHQHKGCAEFMILSLKLYLCQRFTGVSVRVPTKSYSVSSVLWPSFSSRGLGSGEAATNGDRGETEEETGSLAFGRGEEGAVAAEWLLREMTKHGDVGPNAVTLTTTLEAFRK
ncbi:hypothetical protein TGDOM2_399460, partial [Toxoplasma gondii GAB2-2007-GAL-DOM2]